MAIIIYQQIVPKNDKQEVLDYFKANLPQTRSFEGNIEVNLCLDPADDTIRLITKWESLEDYAKYREFRKSLGGKLAEIADVPTMTHNHIEEDY